jgi:hypothetical protein
MAVMGSPHLCFCFRKNKLTMSMGPLPFNSLVHLAESKVGEGIENTWLLEIDPSELGQGSLQN